MDIRSGQVRSGQVRSGQVRSGQVRSGQVRTGQDRTGQDRTGPFSFLIENIPQPGIPGGLRKIGKRDRNGA